MHNRCYNQHDRNIDEVEQYTTKRCPEKGQVAPSDALTEENTVVVVLFDADIAIFAMISIVIDFQVAYTAP